MNELFHKMKLGFGSLRRASFRNPQKNQVVIYDAEGSEILAPMVLRDIPFSILHARQEVVHLTPQIVWRMLKNIGRMESTLRAGVRAALQHPYRLYLLACLDYMKPRVVITFIDNSYTFQRLSRSHLEALFLAVQNGVRSSYHAEQNGLISMPNLFCWGQREVDLYLKYGNIIDRFMPVGPLIGSYYKCCLAPRTAVIQYDLCLVSQWRRAVWIDGLYPDFQEGQARLDQILSRYIQEKGVRACVAAVAQSSVDIEAENNYYRSIYGDEIDIIPQNRSALSTYRIMDSSAVVVGFCSTALYEAFAWRKKVLLCNFTNNPIYDTPMPGIWFITDPEYDAYASRLDQIREMPEEQFRRETRNIHEYVFQIDEAHPAHEVIREVVLEHLR